MVSPFDPDIHLIEERLSGETVFRGKLLDVRKDRIILPSGKEAEREYIVHQGAVLIAAILPDGRMLFERQFRYPLGKVMIEMPAGKIEAGEEPLLAAQRELLEETGYEAETWRHLGTQHPCVGYSSERIEMFLATDLTYGGARHLDEDEHLDVFAQTPADALLAIRRGEITDGKTILALLWSEHVRSGGWV